MQLSNFTKVILAIGLLGFVTLAISRTQHIKEVNHFRQIEIKSNEVKLKELNNKYQYELEHKATTEQERIEQNKRIEELEAEKQRLEQELQAKRQRQQAEEERLDSLARRATGTQTVSAIAGNKESWLRASGIPESEWQYVDYIVSRESSWNPNAVNKSSGACGLGQQLPCGKWAGAWNDPVAALKAQYGYVKARYGGYAQAVAFWRANSWY